jgi:hypothetical protein
MAYTPVAGRKSFKSFIGLNVTMSAGQVSRINYVGPTGGLLTAGEHGGLLRWRPASLFTNAQCRREVLPSSFGKLPLEELAEQVGHP